MKKTISFYLSIFATCIAVLMSLWQLYTGPEPLPAMSQRTLHLTFALVLLFAITPFRKSFKEGNYLDLITRLIFILGVVMSGLYIFLNYETIVYTRAGAPNGLDIFFGIITLLLVLEATRRSIGFIMPIIALLFLLYGFFGNYLPMLSHRGYDFKRIISQMYISQEGIFGMVLGVSATFVFLFILLGSILNHSKSGDIIIDLAYSLFGRFRGGPAKVGVFASGMFGSISGSAVGNVVGTGTFTIPLMRKIGYSRHFAGAVEATASTGGQLMPPLMGSGAFLMVEFTGIPYWEIAIAATIPAILYYISLYFAVDLYAGRKGILGIPKRELPRFWESLKKGWHIFIPIIALLIFLIVFKWSPIKSAFWTIILTLLVTNLRKQTRMSLKTVIQALADGAKNSVEVAAICACAGIVMGVINLTGIGVKLSSILIGAAGSQLWLLLILTMLAAVVLGMGLPTTGAYIVTAILLAPALIEFGIDPLLAHMFVFFFACISAITPPVAMAAYVASGIANSKPFLTALTASRLGIVGFIIPFIIMFNPVLMFKGSIGQIALATLTSLVGLYFLNAAFEGYFSGHITRVFERIIHGVASVLLIIPENTSDFIGFIIVILCAVFYIWKNKTLYRRENKENQINIG